MSDPVLERIEQLRLARGMSMSRLSITAGLAINCYSQVRRRGTATLYALRRFCDVLGMELTMTEKPGPYRVVPLKPCGTVSAARRHQSRGEPMCVACGNVYRAAEARRKRLARSSETTSYNSAIVA